MAELIEERSLAKRKKAEMENKDKENDEEADMSEKGSSLEDERNKYEAKKSKEDKEARGSGKRGGGASNSENKDNANYEEADKSKKGSSLEDDGSEELDEKGEGALDPADSFNPQEYDMTSVQEGIGQSQTMKELDESREVETVRKSRSTKELDKLAEGNNIKQVIEDHFEEKKDEEIDKEEGLGKKPAPKVNKWLSWWKKRLTAAGDLHSKLHSDKEKNPRAEPDKDPN